MQEWLKDKKNLPVVIGVGAFVLIGAIVLILFEAGVLPPQPAPTPVAVASPNAPGAPRLGAPPIAPPPQEQLVGGAPRLAGRLGSVPPGALPAGAAPGQAAGAKAAVAPLNAAKGPDPFKVPGYHPFQASAAAASALRVRNALPVVFIQTYTPKDKLLISPTGGGKLPPQITNTPEVSTTMRMSGVITSDNSVKALLEDNGVTSQVQPGDTVDGGKVLSIQADGLTLRTGDNRLVRVPLSGTTTGGSSPYGGNGSGPGGGNYSPPPSADQGGG